MTKKKNYKDEQFDFKEHKKQKKEKAKQAGMMGQLIGNGKFKYFIIGAVIWFFCAGVYQTVRMIYNITLYMLGYSG